MIALAADENFNNDILRGLRRRNPSIDVVRVQDAGLSQKDDSTILEWCAQAGRVLLTHDVSTMTRHAYDRVKAGKAMPGVLELARKLAIRAAIDEILLIAECSLKGEWEGQVLYLPLK